MYKRQGRHAGCAASRLPDLELRRARRPERRRIAVGRAGERQPAAGDAAVPRRAAARLRASRGEACARVGVAARFKQNVWNATKRARKSGWVDDGAADEFLDRPEAEFEEATSATSAEGEAAAREA